MASGSGPPGPGLKSCDGLGVSHACQRNGGLSAGSLGSGHQRGPDAAESWPWGRETALPSRAAPYWAVMHTLFLGTCSFTCCQGTPSGSPVGGATAPGACHPRGAPKAESLNPHTTDQGTGLGSWWLVQASGPFCWGLLRSPQEPAPCKAGGGPGSECLSSPRGQLGLRLQRPHRRF